MKKLTLLNKIKELYEAGGNIIQYLRSIESQDKNTVEDIMISYDFQAGSYIKYAEQNKDYLDSYTKYIATTLESLGKFNSIMEVGVGEATTLGNVLNKIEKNKYSKAYGFDISWSRIKYANHYLRTLNIENAFLFTADLFHIPMKNNAIDIVYTSHSIEPNGGKEKEALEELYRITNNYLVLLEPSYELANEDARQRMKKNGYITDLYNTAKSLGYTIIEYRLFDICANPLNPTALMIIEKKKETDSIEKHLACPITYQDLILSDGNYYCPESCLVYPSIGGIPCLLPQNAIIATHFLTNLI